ncbi:MAG: FimV/HubP family polar landmark protein [Halioglobus sp.]|nr:FimV/HubP family polar landmark protein [Halioglobus sp.]
MARKQKLAAAVLAMGCLHASTTIALGLGDLQLESFLNQPLKAVVNLRNEEGLSEDQIRVSLATSEDFGKLGVDRDYFLTTINFDVVVDDSGNTRIVISTDQPVLEPYLDFIVEARWPSGRLLREYTVLIDPPVYSEAPVVISASETVAALDNTSVAQGTKPTGLFGADPVGGEKKESGQAQGSEASYSGTRVDIAESRLDSGEMPQRDFNASAASAPAPGVRYMIGRDDTLWDIASRARPAGTSVHQEMLDIQRLNPNAFINGNINRIKAGYIVYLPSPNDISSADRPAALAEVDRQNAAWREGRDDQFSADSGPSLRISAESDSSATEAPEQVGSTSVDEPAVEAPQADESSGTPGDAAVAIGIDAERLAALEDQLETLKRIISLKNDQISALQNALAEADVEAETLVAELELKTLESGPQDAALTDALDGGIQPIDAAPAGEQFDDVVSRSEIEETAVDLEALAAMDEAAEVDEAAQLAALPENPEPVSRMPEAEKKQSEKASEVESSASSTLLYAAGALLAGLVAAYVFIRRRRAGAAEDDAFSDVELKQQSFDEDDVFDAAETPSAEEPRVTPDNRGYGEHKHDHYASDVDASDALAEADIYVAYGRHPQAIDLLNNALNAEPNNPVYRLKLLEIYIDLQNEGGVAAQLERIRENGDAGAIERAKTIVADAGIGSVGVPAATASAGESSSVETDFSELQIEESSEQGSGDIDLDLSADFGASDLASGENEELVIADDSNGLSTKMDLARAYLDMGDEDGARQILDEIIAEGGDALTTEARTLLERIDS